MSLAEVHHHCTEILRKHGRAEASLKILAVSKLQPVEKIRALAVEGQRCFGENYVQEALAKQDSLRDLSLEWHLIGSLQKNKVKMVAGKFSLIHSVDSLALAQTLSKFCQANGFIQDILIQVNLAHEDSKSGFDRRVLLQQWSEIARLPGLRITGLMTMPPLTDEAEEVRPYFRALRELQQDLLKQPGSQGHPLQELSMGTSHDYPVAIEEGATIVRLGTILFGDRPKKN